MEVYMIPSLVVKYFNYYIAIDQECIVRQTQAI